MYAVRSMYVWSSQMAPFPVVTALCDIHSIIQKACLFACIMLNALCLHWIELSSALVAWLSAIVHSSWAAWQCAAAAAAECELGKKVAGSISVYRGKAKQLSMSFHYHDCVLASGDFGQGFSITLLCFYTSMCILCTLTALHCARSQLEYSAQAER